MRAVLPARRRAGGGLGGAAAAGPTGNEEGCEVKGYSEANLQGQSFTTGDSYPTMDEWKQQIGSLEVVSGTWDFYSDDNYGGELIRLTPGQYRTLGDNWTNAISSFMAASPAMKAATAARVARVVAREAWWHQGGPAAVRQAPAAAPSADTPTPTGCHKIRTRPRLERGRVFFCALALASPRVLRQAMPAPVRRSPTSPPLLPPRGALIGLDLGTKTIGVAASDPDRRLADRRRNHRAQDLHRRRAAPARARRRAQGGRLRARPADQHGRQRRAARAVDPRLRAQPREADRACRSRSGTSGSRPPRSSAS